ncbi:hypothetical protein PNEG_00365 [Pneumocystis murina B123]|uniref:DBF4-type domain-containing protein n=1 Tax=Pneumocystis murina (strain B123) TaxID=1069680 RepID=M7NW37_PNEMU|nr:hypothetical protein PNEG_00365 [Pneumocystis murina B123]EMR11336.1 hypothetical protein PNEG_00365 [Pneumocystis murina B123]
MVEHKTNERQPLIARSMNLQFPSIYQQHHQNSEHEISPILKRVLIESPVQKVVDIETVNRKAIKRTKHESPTKSKTLAQTHLISTESWKRTFSIEETNAKVREWQRQYRKAFPSFRFYFDSVDQNVKHKITKQINKLGGTVEAFFSRNITHVITTRPIPDFTNISLQLAQKSSLNSNNTFSMFSASQNRSRKLFGLSDLLKDSCITSKLNQEELLKNDVLIKAHEYDIKIWSFDKFVNRILRSLLDPSLTPNQPKLSHLLYDEKVNGTRERDRATPREDYVYFKGPYLFVRDISNIYRPIIVKEWPKPPNGKISEGEWPQFRITELGHCPFIRDNARKSHPPSSLQKHKVLKELQNIPEPSKDLKEVLYRLKDDSSKIYNQVQSKRYQTDTNASGIIQSNLTSATRSQTSTNARSGGMAGSITIPLSKSVDDLKRKIFIQVQRRSIHENMNVFQQSQIDPTDKKKIKIESRPGYCENCREKFENFDQHINSRRHTKYAANDQNFIELDELLSTLKRKQLPWNIQT